MRKKIKFYIKKIRREIKFYVNSSSITWRQRMAKLQSHLSCCSPIPVHTQAKAAWKIGGRQKREWLAAITWKIKFTLYLKMMGKCADRSSYQICPRILQIYWANIDSSENSLHFSKYCLRVFILCVRQILVWILPHVHITTKNKTLGNYDSFAKSFIEKDFINLLLMTHNEYLICYSINKCKWYISTYLV